MTDTAGIAPRASDADRRARRTLVMSLAVIFVWFAVITAANQILLAHMAPACPEAAR